jgi:hypothetical protein
VKSGVAVTACLKKVFWRNFQANNGFFPESIGLASGGCGWLHN